MQWHRPKCFRENRRHVPALHPLAARERQMMHQTAGEEVGGTARSPPLLFSVVCVAHVWIDLKILKAFCVVLIERRLVAEMTCLSWSCDPSIHVMLKLYKYLPTHSWVGRYFKAWAWHVYFHPDYLYIFFYIVIIVIWHLHLYWLSEMVKSVASRPLHILTSAEESPGWDVSSSSA